MNTTVNFGAVCVFGLYWVFFPHATAWEILFVC